MLRIYYRKAHLIDGSYSVNQRNWCIDVMITSHFIVGDHNVDAPINMPHSVEPRILTHTSSGRSFATDLINNCLIQTGSLALQVWTPNIKEMFLSNKSNADKQTRLSLCQSSTHFKVQNYNNS